MARKTKETEEIKKAEGTVSKITSSATSSIKKVVSSLTKTNSKKSSSKTTTKTKKDEKVTKSKSTVAKKDVAKLKKDSVVQNAKNKTTNSKSNKSTSSKKATNTTMSKYKTAFPEKFEAEYYDFPNGYNTTVVKILAQTPKTLFIYWEISEDDRKSYIEKYGENFFEITKPILTVYNDTLNYSFEVEVNDFANSWYLNINDSKCDYHVEFGRKPILHNQNNNQQLNRENISNPNNIQPKQPIPDYIYLTSSNEMSVPNDKILFNFKNPIKFKNIKTGFETQKDFTFISNLGVLNINSLYKKLFPTDYYNLVNESNITVNNPSSGIFSSQFK